MKDFLVYTSAGLNSNVKQWASSDNRDYNIWVTNYSDVSGNLREYADFYNESKGAKFPNFKQVATENRDLFTRYKAIMVADDDIIISPARINRLFRMIGLYDAWIVTPAFSKFGKISHATTERQLRTAYRYTNFAEVTCPIIRTDKLLSFIDVYDAEMEGYGVDWWYLNHFGKDVPDKIIISDEYYCINPRDFRKSGGTREIDKISSGQQRVDLWERKKQELNINSFDKKVFNEKKRSFLGVLTAMPIYIAEKLFVYVLDGKIFASTRKLLKKKLVK